MKTWSSAESIGTVGWIVGIGATARKVVGSWISTGAAVVVGVTRTVTVDGGGAWTVTVPAGGAWTVMTVGLGAGNATGAGGTRS